jgi:glutaredoxin
MKVVIWSKDDCKFCEQAKNLLAIRKIEFVENKIGHGWTKEQLLESVPNAKTVPQIFINDNLIGGYSELKMFFEKG